MNGLEATKLIKSAYPQVRVLILTQHDDAAYIEPLLRAGASGYVLKRSGGREVLAALRQVHEQGGFLEPLVARQVIESYSGVEYGRRPKEDRKSAPAERLTERERQILQLIIAGKTNKEIAHVLGISAKTVSVHRTNLTTKLGVHSSVELLRYAAQHGLLE